MKMSKRMLALLPAIALVAAACGSSDSSDSADTVAESTDTAAPAGTDAPEEVDQTQSGDLTFAMITHSDDGPFWSVVKKGADAAAEDLGVTLVWKPGVNDAQVMVQDIESAVAEGVDGIAASLPDPDALVSPLQAAVTAGIPVITLNSGANDYGDIGALTHVGQSEDVAGNGAGLRFNEAGATKVLCAYQEQGNVGLEERCNGLAETFEGDTEIEFMGLDADTTEQQNTINAYLAADPDIDGVLGVGPVITMSALRAAQDLGRELTIGGFDLTPELLSAIEAGDVAFTVDQQQYLQGYMPVLLLYLNATNANTLGGGLPILTGPGFVTPENASDVIALSAQGTR
ncbi:MAG: sugar ABC transporter substrate-binding protein [Ilumatobacter sp.]|nr:sugar ABC transporter substrate-binding protein [bacterium]MDG1266297.1 sugar ABC transporter substrate-binding protein [Ilumatobacter sp.]MDG2040783.1 sugar ABC transporter substrate-binding protein [Ilumatobacter sp.]